MKVVYSPYNLQLLLLGKSVNCGKTLSLVLLFLEMSGAFRKS